MYDTADQRGTCSNNATALGQTHLIKFEFRNNNKYGQQHVLMLLVRR